MPQTVAAYRESKVRIYGFSHKVGLTLCSLIFPLERLEYWGQQLERLARESSDFDLVFLRRSDGNTAQLKVVFAGKPDGPLTCRIRKAIKNETATSLALDFPIEMISFHGPHFQDRYGIAHVAFAALETQNMPILAAGCAGTSICIVVPENIGNIALQFLADTFIVPQTAKGDGHP